VGPPSSGPRRCASLPVVRSQRAYRCNRVDRVADCQLAVPVTRPAIAAGTGLCHHATFFPRLNLPQLDGVLILRCERRLGGQDRSGPGQELLSVRGEDQGRHFPRCTLMPGDGSSLCREGNQLRALDVPRANHLNVRGSARVRGPVPGREPTGAGTRAESSCCGTSKRPVLAPWKGTGGSGVPGLHPGRKANSCRVRSDPARQAGVRNGV